MPASPGTEKAKAKAIIIRPTKDSPGLRLGSLFYRVECVVKR